MEKVKLYLISIVGGIISAFGTACFLLPNQLSSGGFSGIATVMYYLYNIPMGMTILSLNLPIFIFAYFREGKSFLFRTIISTLVFSHFIDVFEVLTPFTSDKMLSSVYGGIIIGTGLSLVFKGKSSTGGTDLLANIITTFNKEISLGKILKILDVIVVSANMLLLKKFEIGLYSVIAIYVSNKMIDLFFEGINFSKMIYIISSKNEIISKKINLEINRGVTGFYGKGMYTNFNKIIIMCVAKRRDVAKIKEIAKKIDKNAFIIISDAREVYGLGFKNYSY